MIELTKSLFLLWLCFIWKSHFNPQQSGISSNQLFACNRNFFFKKDVDVLSSLREWMWVRWFSSNALKYQFKWRCSHLCYAWRWIGPHSMFYARFYVVYAIKRSNSIMLCVCVSVQNSLWEEYGSCSLSFWMIRFTSSSEWFTQLNHHYADQSFLKNIPPNVVLCIFARVQCVQEIAAIAIIYI